MAAELLKACSPAGTEANKAREPFLKLADFVPFNRD